MRIVYCKALWGMPDHSFDYNFRKIREAGYDGAEVALPQIDKDGFQEAREKHGIEIAIGTFADTAEKAIADLKAADALKPGRIVMHAGKDSMTREEGTAFWREVLAAKADIETPVAFETHRGRILYSPWVALEYLRDFPELTINADFSHWCCVTESLLPGADEVMDLACERAIHVHARVGFAEGPQVSDPRAPEFAEALEAHERWWDKIREARLADGSRDLWFTPEFGPPPYLPTLPYTRQPVVDLWDICHWLFQRTKDRWGS